VVAIIKFVATSNDGANTQMCSQSIVVGVNIVISTYPAVSSDQIQVSGKFFRTVVVVDEAGGVGEAGAGCGTFATLS